MISRLRIAVAVATVSLALTGCQTTGFDGVSGFGGSSAETASLPADTGPERVSWELYTPLYDQADHLKEILTVDKDVDKAATLYMEQKAFFVAAKGKYQPLLDQLNTALNEPKTAELKAATAKLAAVTWPAPEARWASIKDALGEAKAAASAYPSHAILNEAEFRAPEIDRLTAALARLKSSIDGDAQSRFAAFDHFATGSFFDRYPVDVNRWAFVVENFAVLEAKLIAADTDQLKAFIANYPKDVLQDERWNKVGGYFVAASLREAGGDKSGDLIIVLGAVNAARDAGFAPKQVPGLKVGFVEVTSQTLLKQGQIDFPASVDVNLPVDAVKAELDAALSTPTAKAADLLIVFDVALAKASRRVTGITQQISKVLVGHEKDPNPDYEIARMNLVQAQSNLQTTRIQNSVNRYQGNYNSAGAAIVGGLLQGLAEGIAESSAQDKVTEAMAALQSTPQYIEKPIYQPYKFDKARIHARKAMTVHYYVIDRKKGRYFKSTFDVNEEERFNVAYKIADEDPDRYSHIQAYDTEKEVDEFEKAASPVKLSQLIDHYLANKGKSKKLVNLEAIRQEMLTDKNVALANFKANTFDARPLNDPRFDSVVVVYRGDGALGTGFFVKPDVVLTNWHVVDEFKFVEMKTYDGQETFGKVLGKDVRLDLALVKVQSRGKPIRFYTKNTIDLGATADAIGHPEGNEFSITRGIVSAIRKQHSINLPRGAGDEVLYIQTDTSINPGNSGGPLFLGDRVIGVNTFGSAINVAGRPVSVEKGLNFSVHYSEVLAFLKEHLPGFVVLK